jgi:hypothetical protein
VVDLGDVFSGLGSGIVIGGASWIKGRSTRRTEMKKKAEQLAQAEDLSDRELLLGMYRGLVTPAPTALEPHPPPGLFDRVESIDKHLSEHDRRLDELTTSVTGWAKNAADEIVSQVNERSRVQERDAAS